MSRLKLGNRFPVRIAAAALLSVAGSAACTSGGSDRQVADQQQVAQQAAETRQDGFVSIFDGVSLAGWRGDTTIWRVEDSTLVGEIKPGEELKQNTFIIWEGGKPADFEFVAEYRMTGNGNSGINYRSVEVEGVPFALKGYQADIDAANTYTGQNYEERGRTILAFPGQQMHLPQVDGEIADYAKGNVWTAAEETTSLGEREALKAQIKPNDWNEIRIVANGNRLQHYINGMLMSEVLDDDDKNRKFEGLIGLQAHVGPPMTIAFRNVRLKQL